MTVRDLFMTGIKPAWLVNYKTRNKISRIPETTKIFNELSGEFPYIIFEHRNSVLFFNDELTKEWFEANGCICGYSPSEGKWIQDFKHDILGYVLGFPPSAVASWRNKLGRGRRSLGDRIPVDYYGIQFVCEPHDVENCLNWLKAYRPVPDYVKVQGAIFVGKERIA